VYRVENIPADTVDVYTGIPYSYPMLLTVIEHPTFQRQAEKIWSDEEREEFIAFMAANPQAGTVIPESEGARKVRWTMQGRGKRGGARVIYFNYSEEGQIELFAVYVKPDKDDMPASEIKRKRRGKS
jgi:mRNA-degrading endonuclease RelE of RelBE toxin-antitoxin system